MEQALLDERIEELYQQIGSPLKKIGRFRIELAVLEEEYQNDPMNLNPVQIKRLSSLYRNLGRLRIEMGLLMPLYIYGVMQVAKPSETFEKIACGTFLTASTVMGVLLAYLSKIPFNRAKKADEYLQTR